MSEKTINIEELVQDDHNFNKGTEAGQKLMERSFKELGAGRSILVDRDGRIISGNKSQRAAMAAGIKKVRVIETTGDELIAVKRTDLSLDSKEGREMAYADNLTTQVNLAWDEIELEHVNTDVDGFDPYSWGLPEGIDLGAIDDDKEVEEDEFDEEKDPIETVCQPGDLWQLGNHRLKCGDSTKKEDVIDLMQGETANLWLTDPPYNVAIENSKGMKIANDNMASDEFLKFLTGAFKAAEAVMAKGCPFYVWFASREHINFEKALNNAGLQVRQELIWNKNSLIIGRQDYQWKHEPCLYGWKEGAPHYFIDSRRETTVISDAQELNFDKMKAAEMRELLKQIFADKVSSTIINENKPTKDADHPTMKPVRLFGYQVCNSSKKGDIILDSFGGSGTTLVACEQLGRKARLIEYDPHYADVIIARYEKFTGKKAVKINK